MENNWSSLPGELSVYLPRILSRAWMRVPSSSNLFEAFESDDGIRVLVSLQQQDDNPDKWLHVSLSRADRIPSFEDVKRVKDLFIGDRLAVQIFPPRDQYVNVHQYTLHLFCCINRSILPDFRPTV